MSADKTTAISDIDLFRNYVREYATAMVRALSSPEYFGRDFLFENFAVRSIGKFLSKVPAYDWVCQLNRNVTVFPDGEVYPCYLFKNERMGNVLQEDFPTDRYMIKRAHYDRVTTLESVQARCDTDLWYPTLVGDICLGELARPHNTIDGALALSPHTRVFFDTLCRTVISEMLKVEDDSRHYATLQDNMAKIWARQAESLGLTPDEMSLISLSRR